MKLPSKIEVNNLKASERKKEIDEGVKLAKKVDTLRELSTKEQVNLSRFRDESLKVIQNEIEQKITERDVLIKEIELKQEEKRKIKAPFDLVQEWEKVKKDSNEIELLKNNLREREANLIFRESKVEVGINEITKKEDDLKEKETLTNNYLSESSKNYDESEKVKLETKKLKDKTEKFLESESNRLKHLEEDLKYKETDLKLEKEMVEKEKLDIEKEKIHIISQQETLRVAWENIKKLQK